MISVSIFWFLMGIVSVLIIVGAKEWADAKGLIMTWWKWILVICWYAAFLFAVAVPMTFIGEGEPAAGFKMFLFSVVPAIILGFAVWRVISNSRQPEASE